KSQGDLRGVAIQRLADKIAALVCDGNDRTTFSLMVDHVTAIDPQMTISDAIRAFFGNPYRIHRRHMLRLPRMVTKSKEPPINFNPQNTRAIDYEKDLADPGE